MAGARAASLPPKRDVARALVAKPPVLPEPAPAQPVVLRRPAVEPLPVAVAVPKRKIGVALKQAKEALLAGSIDERNLSSSQAPPEIHDTSTASAGAPSAHAPDTHAPGTPGSSDALALYRGVLATDPGNVLALHGIDAVDAALHARAQAALAREDMVNAQRDADRLKLLHPDDAGLPALTAELNKGWRVAGLIERGQRLESAGALISPRGANAAAAYRQALTLERGSAAADTGLARIEGVFIARSLAEAEAARYPQSDRLIAQAASLRSDSQALQDAAARIVAIREHHAAALEAEADAALAADDPNRAEQLLKQVERAAPLSQEGALVCWRCGSSPHATMGNSCRPRLFTEPLASTGRSPGRWSCCRSAASAWAPSRMTSQDTIANEAPQRTHCGFKHGFAMARTDITVERNSRHASCRRRTTVRMPSAADIRWSTTKPRASSTRVTA